MMVRSAHAAVLAACLRNQGWRPLAQACGAAGDAPRVAAPTLAASAGSRLHDPGIWQWWVRLDAPADGARPAELSRMFAVALGDASLADLILDHGPHWAPSPGSARQGGGCGGSALAPGAAAGPAKD
jgi:hypothetical protein